jgi:SSS family solute:Na+ symporter
MHLSLLDLLILAVYFAAMIGLGVWLAPRETSTEDYFVGGRSVPGWALGLSILGTCISSVTYVAYPGKAFVADWQYLCQGLMLPVLIVAGGLAVVPFYRRAVRTSINEYVESRFGPGVRLFSLAVIATAELARLAMVMYLVSLVVSTITGLNIVLVIAITGIATVIYTVLGGIEGVIWTDVAQSIALIAGGLVVLVVVAVKVPGGPGAVIAEAAAAHKFKLLDLAPTLARPTFWVLALSGVINYFYFLAGNQNQIQRYQCAGSDAEAKKAALIGSLSSVFVWCLFLAVGTCLWVYYQHFPDPEAARFAAAGKGDKVFPLFIGKELPPGVAGILLAGLFAAAMSTLSSSMNVLSTLMVVDLYRRFLRPDAPDERALQVAKGLTLFWGLFGIGLALLMTQITTFLDFYFEIVSIITGLLAGVFFLALFSRRASGRGVMTGIVAGVLVTAWGSSNYGGWIRQLWPALAFPWDQIMVGVATTTMVIVVGWTGSLILRPTAPPGSPPPVLQDRWLENLRDLYSLSKPKLP